MKGEFVRKDSGFRNWITSDGRAGPTGVDGFAAEIGRYHLYISHACPWAHRVMIFRVLKGLSDAITFSVVHPLMPSTSWEFGEYPGSTPDTVNGASTMQEVYRIADSNFDGVVTVPVLWDKKRQTIVNNESSEIIRMFNSAFVGIARDDVDFYPEALRNEVDELNETVYESLNNGVYRCGFATTQAAYETAFDALFSTLDLLEERLSKQRYLVGGQLTEADWRLFTTLIRFDPVYHGHFKCNKRRLIEYPNLWNYMLDLYQVPGVAETVDMNQIKYHYYASHGSVNPTGVVPKGPEIDYQAQHNRDALAS